MAVLEIEPLVGGLTYDAATAYTIADRSITFTNARLYVTGLVLLGADGSETVVPTPEAEVIALPAKDENDADVTYTTTDRVLYYAFDQGETTKMLGEFPAGEYTGLRFMVGMTDLLNRVDATAAPATHPLAKREDVNNHWSWNSGYIYLRFDGEVDGDATPDGTRESAWRKHLGSDPFAATVTVDFGGVQTLNADAMQTLQVAFDFATLIEGNIDLADADERDSISIRSDTERAVAGRVVEDMEAAFSFRALTSAGN